MRKNETFKTKYDLLNLNKSTIWNEQLNTTAKENACYHKLGHKPGEWRRLSIKLPVLIGYLEIFMTHLKVFGEKALLIENKLHIFNNRIFINMHCS